MLIDNGIVNSSARIGRPEQLQRELGLKREREELEKKQRKELDAIFKQQAERLDDELKQVQTMKAMLGERWRALEQHKREKINVYGVTYDAMRAGLGNNSLAHTFPSPAIQWQRFLECDQLPDPSSEREINTYMSMLREEVKCDYQSMDLLMEKLEEMDKVLLVMLRCCAAL